jgi:hypothetical protein
MTMMRSRIFTASRKPTNLMGEIAGVWHDLAKALFNPYRPERHYMRGPGPAWHARHGLPAAVFVTREVAAVELRPIPVLARVRG